MTCPTCQTQTQVIDSRSRNGEVYRRRCCKNGHRFSTLEKFQQHIRNPVCEATGLRSYSIWTVIQKEGSPMQCSHCNAWHLTPAGEPAKPTQQT